MKKSILFTFAFLFIGFISLKAQHDVGEDGTANNKAFPSVKVTDLNGNTVSTDDFQNEDGPIIVSFWATWCKPCILELTTIADEYEDWVEETGVKLIAVSIDDSRNMVKVGPFVNGRGWDYEVYIDGNQDLKRALGVSNVPHTFVLDKDRNIVYSHNSYSPGDEVELREVLQQLVDGE